MMMVAGFAVVIGLQGFVIDLTHNYIGSFVVVLLAAAYIFYYASGAPRMSIPTFPVE